MSMRLAVVDDTKARIDALKAEMAVLADRLMRVEAAQDLNHQNQRSALDRLAKAAEEIVRIERRR
jgi:hypothetical protein